MACSGQTRCKATETTFRSTTRAGRTSARRTCVVRASRDDGGSAAGTRQTGLIGARGDIAWIGVRMWRTGPLLDAHERPISTHLPDCEALARRASGVGRRSC